MSGFGKCSGGGRRSAARAAAPLAVILTTVGQSWCAALVDISRTGARVCGSHLPAPGEYLQVRVETILAFATIKWVTGDQCGLEFEEPIPADELARLRQSGAVASLTQLTVNERLALDSWLIGNGR